MNDKQRVDAEVIVVGAGPVGLTTQHRTPRRHVHAGARRHSPDYPRAVGMDDESSHGAEHRFDQAGAAAPDPYHWMFRQCHGRLPRPEPSVPTSSAGPGRNAFNQRLRWTASCWKAPKRFPNASVSMSTELESFEQDGRGVTLKIKKAGVPSTLRCRYLVGSDGGRSVVRTS